MFTSKILRCSVVAAASMFALSGCVFVPATNAPTPVPTVEPAEVEPVEVAEPAEEPTPEPEPSLDDIYLETVRTGIPETNWVSDTELLQMAEDSCTVARFYGFDEGLDQIIYELAITGGNETEAYNAGFIYGAAVTSFCPEVMGGN